MIPITPKQMSILMRIEAITGIIGDSSIEADLSVLHAAGMVTRHAITRIDADLTGTPVWVYRISGQGMATLAESRKAVR